MISYARFLPPFFKDVLLAWEMLAGGGGTWRARARESAGYSSYSFSPQRRCEGEVGEGWARLRAIFLGGVFFFFFLLFLSSIDISNVFY